MSWGVFHRFSTRDSQLTQNLFQLLNQPVIGEMFIRKICETLAERIAFFKAYLYALFKINY